MQTQKYQLKEIANIITGLPIQRYIDKPESIPQQIISNMSKHEIDEEFTTEEVYIADDIKKQFLSKEHDILYKVQQQSFAKEITTETGIIIPNTYLIIRVDPTKVNPTYLANYLNNPQIEYEITRQIESTRILKVNTGILKELTIILPDKKTQDKIATLSIKINQRIQLKKQSMEADEQLINSLYDNVIGDNYGWIWKKNETNRYSRKKHKPRTYAFYYNEILIR